MNFTNILYINQNITRAFYVQRLLAFLFTILSINTVIAQTVEEDGTSYSSPSTAQQSQNANVGVDLYSGTANISIPLPGIKSETYQLPITLNYSASGVRVGQLSGWTGLGWNLNAGGAITRIVKGLPDGCRALNDNGTYYSNVGYLYSGATVQTLADKSISQLSTTEKDFLFEDKNDTEPDRFQFNLGGSSGTFFFDQNGEPRIEGRSDIKIEYELNASDYQGGINFGPGSVYIGGITSFTITNTDGYKFVFDALGISFTNVKYPGLYEDYVNHSDCEMGGVDHYDDFPNGIDVPAYVTSWHLKEIISPFVKRNSNECVGGNEIRFVYSEHKYQDDSQIKQNVSRSVCGTSSLYRSHARYINTQYVQVLDEIIYGDGWGTNYGKVVFESNQTRSDLYVKSNSPLTNPKALSKIIYRSFDPNDQDNTIIEDVKNIQFNYNTFAETNITGCTTQNPFLAAHKKRLKLTSIREFTSQGTTSQIPAYTFTYDNTPLPPRHSWSVDFWGYYNGISNPSDLAPTIYAYPTDFVNNSDIYKTAFSHYPRPSGTYTGSQLTFNGANRTPNFIYAKAGVLEKIENPNGATIDLNYELNTYRLDNSTQVYTGGGLRLKQQLINDGFSNINTINYFYDSNENGTGVTTGRLLEDTNFGDKRNKSACNLSVQSAGGWNNYVDRVRLISSENKATLPYSIGYKKVTTSTSLGKSVSEYNLVAYHGIAKYDCTTPASNDCSFKVGEVDLSFPPEGTYKYPFPMQTNYEWRNRLLLSNTTYRSNGTLQGKVENEYDLQSYETILAGIAIDNLTDVNGQKNYCWGRYQIVIPDLVLTNTTQTMYEEGVTTPMVTLTNYEYSNDHSFLKASSTTNSDGKVYRTEYFYPNDPGYIDADLVADNRIQVPVETILKVNGAIVNGSKIIFNDMPVSNLAYLTCEFDSSFYTLRMPRYFQRFENSTWVTYKENARYRWTGLLTEDKIIGHRKSNYTFSNGILKISQWGNRVTEYQYYADRQVSKITHPDDQETDFTYDGHNRLLTTINRNGLIQTGRVYSIDLINGNDNFVSSTISYNNNGNYPGFKVYSDGLGRTIKKEKSNYTPSGGTYLQSMVYDNLGRMTESCDPGSGGCTEYVYENTLSSRMIESEAPGWIRDVETEYLFNVTSDNVLLSGTTNYYPPSSLYKLESKDEDNRKAHTFKDKMGRTILVRRFKGSTRADTYYRYDDKGRLLFVLPPGVTSNSSTLAYKYEYYDDDNLHKKYIPNQGWYEYTYTTGDLVKTAKRPDNFETFHEYNDYDQLEKITNNSTGQALKEIIYKTAISGINLGKVDKTISYRLDTYTSLETSYSYDSYGRVHQEVVDNHLGGQDTYTYTYDLRDLVTNISRTHIRSGQPPFAITKRYVYDKASRLEDVFMSVNGGNEQQLSHSDYDEKDRLIQKNLGVSGSNELQSIDYAYNARGWLTKINDVFQSDAACPSDPFFLRSGEGGGDNSYTAKGAVTYSYSPEAIAKREQSNIEVFYNLDYLIEEKAVKNVQGDFKIEFGKQSRSKSSYVTRSKTLSIEGVVNKDRLIELLANSIRSDVNKYISQQKALTNSRKSFRGEPITREEERSINQSMQSNFGGGGFGGGGTGSNPNPENDLFAENIYYNSSLAEVNATGRYNGAISYVHWRVHNRLIRTYGYEYDGLDRLEKANFIIYDEDECEYSNVGRYDVEIIYDNANLRGNISQIKRNGLTSTSGSGSYGAIDDLTMSYTGDQLNNISENSSSSKGFKGTSGAITYDNMGRLKTDPSRNITNVAYNHLDLPTTITISGFPGGGTISFIYDSDGNMLQKETQNNTGTTITYDYVGGIEYINDAIRSVHHEEGRFVKNGAVWENEYVLNDHLGNSRVFFIDKNNNGSISTTTASGEVTNEAHYYPFGLQMDGNGWYDTYTSTKDENRFLYNGIEETTFDDLSINNAFYRTLDPAIGRWWQVDPMTEEFYGLSPYNSMANNPISNIDPNGDWVHIAIGAVAGGVINLGVKVVQGKVNSFGDGLAAFGIGAAAGAVTAATGGAASGALFGYGTVASGFATGVISGAVGAATGSIIQGVGNNFAFGDPYGGEQFGRDVLFGAITGGVFGAGAGAYNQFFRSTPPPESILKLKPPGSSSGGSSDPLDLALEAAIKTGRPTANFPGGEVKVLVDGKWVPYLGDATKGAGQFLRFGGDEAVTHFGKHSKSIMDALGESSYNLRNYLDDANHIIKNGTYVPELNGYVRLIGGQGSAKYGFVGMNRATGNITTFHIKTAKELSKKAPGMFSY